MKLLKTISDIDFFPNIEVLPIENKSISRTAVRTVLYNEYDKIALVGDTYVVLPGGAMNIGESYENTIRREIKEEIGCEIDIIEEIGRVVEYRNKGGVIQESYCFISKIKKDGPFQTIQMGEIEKKIIWCGLNEAVDILNKEFNTLTNKDYHSYFNIEVSRIFLNHLSI